MEYADGSTKDTNNLDPNKLGRLLIVLIFLTILVYVIKTIIQES